MASEPVKTLVGPLKSSGKFKVWKGGAQSSGLSVGKKVVLVRVPHPPPTSIWVGDRKRHVVSVVGPLAFNLVVSSSFKEDPGAPQPHRKCAHKSPSSKANLKSLVAANGMLLWFTFSL
jgi:hypothetical protein